MLTQIDPLDDFKSPVMASVNLLVDLAVDRRKVTLVPILNFINHVMTTYSQTPEDSRNPRHKDGALHMMACLSAPLSSRVSLIIYILIGVKRIRALIQFSSKFVLYIEITHC